MSVLAELVKNASAALREEIGAKLQAQEEDSEDPPSLAAAVRDVHDLFEEWANAPLKKSGLKRREREDARRIFAEIEGLLFACGCYEPLSGTCSERDRRAMHHIDGRPYEFKGWEPLETAGREWGADVYPCAEPGCPNEAGPACGTVRYCYDHEHKEK